MAISTKLGGVILTLLLLNFACAALFGYPLVYCVGRSAFAPLAIWLQFSNMVMLALMIAAFIWDGYRPMAKVAVALILLNALPAIASSAFGLGMSCGLERHSAVKPERMAKPAPAVMEAAVGPAYNPPLPVRKPYQPLEDGWDAEFLAALKNPPCYRGPYPGVGGCDRGR